jgi:hypothetical protein
MLGNTIWIELPATALAAFNELRGIILPNLHSVLSVDFLYIALLESILSASIFLLPLLRLLPLLGRLLPLVCWLSSRLWFLILIPILVLGLFVVLVIPLGLVIIFRVVLFHLVIDVLI